MKIKRCGEDPNGQIFNLTLYLKLQGLWKERWKDCKSQSSRKFTVRLSLLGMSEATLTHEVSSTRLPTHKLNKENTEVEEWGGRVRWP